MEFPQPRPYPTSSILNPQSSILSLLSISLTRHADNRTVLRCERADGSVTWQRQSERQGAFYPLHDITHFVIESELGIARAFYGLIASGWNIEDTTGKGARGALPPDALAVEHLVGLFDLERSGSVRWTADALHRERVEYARRSGLPEPREVSEAEVERIRARIRELIEVWEALGPGEAMRMSFDVREGSQQTED